MYRAQHGSIAAVVIGVLVVALSAALGLLFYQNFIAKPTQPVITAGVNEEVAPRTKQVAFGGSIYELTYPGNGWTAVTTPVEGSKTGASDTYFTDLDDTVKVRFGLSEDGIGSRCDVNDTRRIGFYNVNTESPNDKLTGEEVYLVEAIYDGLEGGYQYVIGLTPDSGATHAAVGQSPCNVAYVGVVSRVVLVDGAVKQPTIIATILFPKLDDSGKAQSEMQPIKDMMTKDTFRQAMSILLSARKK